MKTKKLLVLVFCLVGCSTVPETREGSATHTVVDNGLTEIEFPERISSFVLQEIPVRLSVVEDRTGVTLLVQGPAGYLSNSSWRPSDFTQWVRNGGLRSREVFAAIPIIKVGDAQHGHWALDTRRKTSDVTRRSRYRFISCEPFDCNRNWFVNILLRVHENEGSLQKIYSIYLPPGRDFIRINGLVIDGRNLGELPLLIGSYEERLLDGMWQ